MKKIYFVILFILIFGTVIVYVALKEGKPDVSLSTVQSEWRTVIPIISSDCKPTSFQDNKSTASFGLRLFNKLGSDIQINAQNVLFSPSHAHFTLLPILTQTSDGKINRKFDLFPVSSSQGSICLVAALYDTETAGTIAWVTAAGDIKTAMIKNLPIVAQ